MCVVTDRIDGHDVTYRPTSCPCDCPRGWIDAGCGQPESAHRQELPEPPLAEQQLPDVRLAAASVTGTPMPGLPMPAPTKES